jgi:hypothetical protein
LPKKQAELGFFGNVIAEKAGQVMFKGNVIAKKAGRIPVASG